MKRLLILLLVPALLLANGITIRQEDGTYRVTGWTPTSEPEEGWASIFTVHAGDAGMPAMLGKYAVESGALTFRPRFAPAAGVTTKAVFRLPGTPAVEATFASLPMTQIPATTVRHVYPSTNVIPENLLKFYVEFSAPMSRGEAWTHMHLLRPDGTRVDLPFLEIDQELWDSEYKRLTVLFDPGRIKRGVLPLKESGPALEAGKTYTLVIEPEWRDATGAPLKHEYRKTFRVIASDRTPLDTRNWRIRAPQAGTTDPLIVDTPEPLDYAVALSMISVKGVAGTPEMASDERQLRITPDAPWTAGSYELMVDTALEDLAGNRVGRAFDVDTFERISKRVVRQTVSLPFRIGR